jgi:hypothetical protein
MFQIPLLFSGLTLVSSGNEHKNPSVVVKMMSLLQIDVPKQLPPSLTLPVNHSQITAKPNVQVIDW